MDSILYISSILNGEQIINAYSKINLTKAKYTVLKHIILLKYLQFRDKKLRVGQGQGREALLQT